MGIRETLNENQNAVVVGAVVVIATAVIYISWQSLGGGGSRYQEAEVYYKDVVTGKEFLASTNLVPPIESPDGNPAVRVQYFSCSDGCGKDERFVGYYVKFTDEMKRRIEEQRQVIEESEYDEGGGMSEEVYQVWEEMDQGELYAIPREGRELDLSSPDAWTPMLDSTEALEDHLTCEGSGDRAHPCFPE